MEGRGRVGQGRGKRVEGERSREGRGRETGKSKNINENGKQPRLFFLDCCTFCLPCKQKLHFVRLLASKEREVSICKRTKQTCPSMLKKGNQLFSLSYIKEPAMCSM
jgi:hypothetical protein